MCRFRRRLSSPHYVWAKSDLILRMRERRRRPVPAQAGSNVSIPQVAFIAALRMEEE
jgi:hypothetical protein